MVAGARTFAYLWLRHELVLSPRSNLSVTLALLCLAFHLRIDIDSSLALDRFLRGVTEPWFLETGVRTAYPVSQSIAMLWSSAWGGLQGEVTIKPP